ncbi:unnamed protein product [Diamesa serratosioi]
MTQNNRSLSKFEQNDPQMQFPKFIFRSEQSLKAFYLTNSFNSSVSKADEHFRNSNIIQTQHPQQKYKLAKTIGMNLLNKALQYKIRASQDSSEFCNQEFVEDVLTDGFVNIDTKPVQQCNNIQDPTDFCKKEMVDDLLLEDFVSIDTQTVQESKNTGTIRKVGLLPKPTTSYNELVENSAKNVVTNKEEFVCSICEMFIEIDHGIVLKECFHTFCRLCIVDSIEHTASMVCPYPIENCKIDISDTEARALLSPASYTRVIQKMLNRFSNEELKQVDDLPEIYYLEELDANTFIENKEPFSCPICMIDIDIGAGVVLKNCLHMFCKKCMNKTIEHSNDIEIKCPFMDDQGSCEFHLQDSEFRSMASENAIKQQFAKSLKQAELSAAGSAFHCKHPNCDGWVINDLANVADFICEVCLKRNCITCKVIHEGKTCQQYQDEINPNARNLREAAETENAVHHLIINRQAMKCPHCGIVVQKTTGCNNMQCGACRNNFVWQGI